MSNLGMFGIGEFSAIINPPQGGILAVGSSVSRVVLEAGKPRSKSFMTASLSADARAIPGSVAESFLDAFRRNMESPAKLLL